MMTRLDVAEYKIALDFVLDRFHELPRLGPASGPLAREWLEKLRAAVVHLERDGLLVIDEVATDD